MNPLPHRSLQWRISLYISLSVLLFAAAVGTLSFNHAYRDAQDLQDREMENLVKLVNTEADDTVTSSDISTGEAQKANSASATLTTTDDVPDTQIAETADGNLDDLFDNQPMTETISHLADGFHTLHAPAGTAQWRIYLHSISRTNRLLIVQSSRYRHSIALKNAWSSLWPLLLLIPVLILVTNLTVYRLFRPLRRLTGQIVATGPAALAESHDPIPSELQPFIDTIRTQIDQIQEAQDQNRRFVANAAHQMRTPLAALILQAEQLKHAETEPQRRQATEALQSSLSRHRHLLNDLLTFARSEDAAVEKTQALPLKSSLLAILPDIALLAENKQQDFSVSQLDDAILPINERDWQTLCQNLLENAVKYTPEQGRICLSLTEQPDRIILQLDDSGPGIATNDYADVFKPFFCSHDRAEKQGSGLGLAIVHNLVRRYHGTIELNRSVSLGGLYVLLTLPKSQNNQS